MVNTTDPTVTERRASDIGSALELLRKELCKNEGLEEQAIKCTILICQSYVFAGHTPTVMVHEPTDATLRQPNPAS